MDIGSKEYVGRTVAVGLSASGKAAVLYRVSSRSFLNRTAKAQANRISIVPTEGFEHEIFVNPYITYNSIRVIDDKVVVSNGSHTDIIAERIQSGMSVRDAMTLTLLSMDYEHDSLNTPRIAGVIDVDGQNAFLGIVTINEIRVSRIPITPNECYFVSTYDTVGIGQKEDFMQVENADVACHYIMEHGVFGNMLHGVVSAVAFETSNGFDLSVYKPSLP